MNPSHPSAASIHRKLKLAGELFQFALEIKKTQLRLKHPDWTEPQVAIEAYRLLEKGSR